MGARTSAGLMDALTAEDERGRLACSTSVFQRMKALMSSLANPQGTHASAETRIDDDSREESEAQFQRIQVMKRRLLLGSYILCTMLLTGTGVLFMVQ